ncbi:glycogen debranching protein GlgX [Sanguibacter sp. A247]|uniref:glycogen debranching protein GlgX n=1 Tax=unclassified Sanguibacter TaxID=2645534 RepID=UPI003FD84FE7
MPTIAARTASDELTPPLGAHVVDGGTSFAVVASHAESVDLCLLDPAPSSATGWTERRLAMTRGTRGVWHLTVPHVGAGQRYGFRAHGRWDPSAGLRYNPAKLLVDPYARGLEGEVVDGPAVYGHSWEGQGEDGLPLPSEIDSLGHVPLSVVVDSTYRPHPSRPRIPWSRTVVYEAHVRGLTAHIPGVPDELRGTYAGLAHPATIDYLRSLGITTLELLPIHAKVSEPHLVGRGLTNYWGYNTLGFFAPEPSYATAAARDRGPTAVLDEVKGMVALLHEAGLEVLLDVVYNHTAEGGTDGMQLSWRGLDATVHYLHDGGAPARFADTTGCGNTLDHRRTRPVQAALDSVRYWAHEIGVDGFRFDLAVTLGRHHDGFTNVHPFLVALATDPALADVKLVAEPWDVGPGGWQTGSFKEPFSEWNDRFRSAVRQFWLADARELSHGRTGQGMRDLATRLSGSADLFGHSDPPLERGPVASINFVTAHDGFTMADLTRYDHKHNEANGEDNRDGTDDNRSWNHGIEGADGDVDGIASVRRRSHRNLLGTLLLSAGTPMITAGDEVGHSQHGNNNTYCQDNELTRPRFDADGLEGDLRATTQYLLARRAELAALRPARFYLGKPFTSRPDDGLDLAWYSEDGTQMTSAEWNDTSRRVLQMVRRTADAQDPAVRIVLNGSLDVVDTVAPEDHVAWELVWDSSWEHPDERFEPAEDLGSSLEPLSMRLYVEASH